MTSNKKIGSILHDVIPPAVVKFVRNLRGGIISYDGDFRSWEDAESLCTGYDAENILDKVLKATLKVQAGEAAYERDSVVFNEIEYTWPVLTGLMWAAARNCGRLNVLDFGGALGSSYFQNQLFLQRLPEVRWNVVEQAHYVETGRRHIQDEQLLFYKSTEECISATQPNVILLSSVLQYLKSPIDVIQSLSDAGATCLIIDRTPFSSENKDKILIQSVPPAIYSASYPMWVFSHQEFVHRLAADWSEVASHLSPEGFVKAKSGLEFSFRGLVLETQR